MPEQFKPYNFDQARDEATKMEEKIKSGEVKEYNEANNLLKRDKQNKGDNARNKLEENNEQVINNREKEEIKQALKEILEIINDGVDAIIFLDKKARPLSWAVRDILSDKNNEKSGNLPKIKFLNIPNNEIKDSSEGEWNQEFNYQEIINLERLKKFYKDFNTILIVDEFVSSGKTKEKALLAASFLIDKKPEECIYRTKNRKNDDGEKKLGLETDFLVQKKKDVAGYKLISALNYFEGGKKAIDRIDKLWDKNGRRPDEEEQFKQWKEVQDEILEECEKKEMGRIIFYNANCVGLVGKSKNVGLKDSLDKTSFLSRRVFHNKESSGQKKVIQLRDEILKIAAELK